MKSTDEKDKENYKTISVKIKKEIENNRKIIIDYIKDIDEISIKVLFFLFCYDNLNMIDVDYLAECVSEKNKTDIKKITDVLDFWQRKRILEYNFNKADDIVKADNTGEMIDTDADSAFYEMPVIDISKLKNKNSGPLIDKLSEALETKDDFRRLIHDIQSKFQSIFNPTELGVMYNLYEVNKVDKYLLLKLTDICVLDDKNNVRYLEKIAIGLCSNGILTVEDYEKNYNEILKIKELEEKILKIFKIQDHKFTSQEKSFVKKWALEYGFSDDMIEEGYNICMKNIFELNFRYINGIFRKWNEKGLTTLEDIKTEFNETKGFRATEAKGSSFNAEQFFEKAVQKAMIHYDDDEE